MQNDILAKILAAKAKEVAAAKAEKPLQEMRAMAADAPPVRGFVAAIETAIASGRPAVIAELKKASPSKGLIRDWFRPAELAAELAENGATCLSVLTDEEFFQGHARYLTAAHDACNLPLLRKDFIIDEYQIYEAKAMRADAVLLIVAALDDERLHALAAAASEAGLDALLEVHDADELRRALQLPCKLIGINNRNLRTFDTRLETTLELLDAIPCGRIVVTESGINTTRDVMQMRAAGVHAFLTGEALMRAPAPGAMMQNLFGLCSR